MAGYQVLYAVPSNGEISAEFECTSVMPGEVCCGSSRTGSESVCQSFARVMGSVGTPDRYFEATKSSSEVGPASLSSVYCWIALRMTKRSCFNAASRPRITDLSYRATAMPIRIKMIVITTSSSSNEKPDVRPRRRVAFTVPDKFERRKWVREGGLSFTVLYQSEYFVPSVAVPVD
jgi:hypothetical protein